MRTLYDLAQEYKENLKLVESRIEELERMLNESISTEKKRRIRRRLNALHKIQTDNTRIIREMENYYET